MRLTQLVESIDESAVVILVKEDDHLEIKIKNIVFEFLNKDINEIVKGKKMREIIIGDEKTAFAKFNRQDNDTTIELTVGKLDQTITQKFDADELIVALRFITNN